MPCTISNRTPYRLNIPNVDDILMPYETKTYAFVERDVLVNDPRVVDLVTTRKIIIQAEPGSSFAAAWDTNAPFRMEPYQMWLDASDTLRMVDGVPVSDTDGFVVGGGEPSYPLETVQNQIVRIRGRSFAQVRSSFFGWWWHDDAMATWDNYWQYCLWSFAPTIGAHDLVWSPLTRFATQGDLFDYMEVYIPSSGGVYSEEVAFRIIDEIDARDPYPVTLVHRNSLVASMAGRSRWTRKRNTWYGVDSKFNAPAYYTNFYGELGSRFVQTATSILPAINNDDCVWYPRASRSLWHWPTNGSGVVIGTNSRGAAWDTITGTWITPAPAGHYVVSDPFLLHEYRRNKILNIYDTNDTYLRQYEMDSVAAQVFPCVSQSRYWGFLVQPHGGDTWVTEYHDTTRYVVTLKLRYSGAFRHRYVGISPWPTPYGNRERLQWSHFDPLGSGSYLLRKQRSQFKADVDTNVIPTTVYMCRRDVTTGRRSRWVPIYNIKRRLNNASLRIEPAF